MIYTNPKNVKIFEKYFLQNYPRVKGFAIKILKNEEDAEDVAQDIFIKIWNQPEIWSSDQYSSSYIYTMTKNHIFNLLKRRQLEQKYQEHAMYVKDTPDFTPNFEKDLYSKELKLMYKMKIDQMPEQRRRIFKLSRFSGKSNQEIAELLNLSIRTVERHIYLALNDLKQIPFILIFILF